MKVFSVNMYGLVGVSQKECPYKKGRYIGSFACVNCTFFVSERIEKKHDTLSISHISCRCDEQIEKIKKVTNCNDEDIVINSLFVNGGTF